jgi:soluble lytic murein transglycosylase-like protein
MKAKKPAQKKLTTSKNYNSLIRKAASKYQVEPDLIKAVIKTESNGNYRAVSKKGAMGLMQLMPTTANDMSVSNPYNPEQNIEGGTKYLRLLLDKFNGDLTLALAAYNAGPKVVEKYGNVPPYSETKNYVKKVFSLYKGKRRYALGEPVKKQTPVYKVTLEDGTVLFTNSPLLKPGSVRF